MLQIGIDVGSLTLKVVENKDGKITVWPITEVLGKPWQLVLAVLKQLQARGIERCKITVTGSGVTDVAQVIGLQSVQEQIALVTAVGELYPETRTIIEMGRKTQKCMILAADPKTGRLTLKDERPASKCASGCGAFIDSMVKQLEYETVDEFVKAALNAQPVILAGRCVVFMRSEVIHKRNKGITRERLAAGINKAICINFRSNFARGSKFEKPIFIGGVSENGAVVGQLKQVLKLEDELVVPEYNRVLGAIGSAMCDSRAVYLAQVIEKLETHLEVLAEYDAHPRLELDNVVAMPTRSVDDVPAGTTFERVGIGVDIGSTSTKSAAVGECDGKLVVLASDYGLTGGDPLAATRRTLAELKRQLEVKDFQIGTIVAATTGSGRYLTARFVGTELVKDEISAQAASVPMYDPEGKVDTIFEIGGQDSKYIRLSGEVITDFEMNRACAAGCGAFLETTAAALGMQVSDFGQAVEENKRPPKMDTNCAVFTEEAMVHHQLAGVSTADLAAGVCLASVENYIAKNVGGREIGKRIAFQGAPAKNPAMVAAFAQITGKPIVIPPYPEITGAIGAARQAYLDTANKASFRGFEAIADVPYEVSSFQCKSCANQCEVSTFQIEGGVKYFYDDRCEKYSGNQKPDLGKHLPNLFTERVEMMKKWAGYYGKAPDGAKTIGIPQGGLYSDYQVLWKPFFTLLGYEVVTSDDTNPQIIELGVERAVGEPCFPFKVAGGHFANMVGKKPDYIFYPHYFSAEKSAEMRRSTICSFWPAAPSVFKRATPLEGETKLLTPELHFDRGMEHIGKRIVEMAVKELGCDRKKAEKAFVDAYNVLALFHKELQKRGREILEELPKDALAFVVVARPYTSWDPRMRLGIDKRIQELGILAIPQDMLPLEEANISDSWPNAYARQIQKKLKAARLIRQDVRLRAVVVTYFACGQDSFGNPFFQDEIGEPCYVMYLDEHSSDAGIATRIEAFADTAKHIEKAKDFQIVRSQDDPIKDLKGHKVWIPSTCRSADMLAAAMTAFGIEAAPIPASPDSQLTLARQAIPEDVCLPMFRTTEDILYRLTQPDFDRQHESFFMVNSQGPCRVGMYSMYQRRILDKMGYADVPIVTIGSMNTDAALGISFGILAWAALVTPDVLFKMLLKVRPYAMDSKDAEDCFERHLSEAIKAIPEVKRRIAAHPFRALASTSCLRDLVDVLKKAAQDFATIPCRKEDRPLVAVIGEWFVRLNDFSNQDLLRKLEAAGAETWLAPATEFMGYSNCIDELLSADRWHDGQHTRDEAKEYVQRRLNSSVMARYERVLFGATLPFMEGYEDIGPREIIENGTQYVSRYLGGEAICSMGTSVDFARRGFAGIVNNMPFGCGPSTIVSALSEPFRDDYGGLPWLNLAFNGFEDPLLLNKLATFVWRAKIYKENRN